MSTVKITVVIPAYQVENEIVAVINAIPDFVTSIIIIDDASPIPVRKAISHLTDPRICLIRHEKNQGVGGAMITGYYKAIEIGAGIIVKVDGDGQMNAKYIPRLVQPLIDNEADYCKGNRFVHAKELSSMPFWRRLGNITHSYLCKLSSGYWHIFDPTNGYTAIRGSTFQALDLNHLSSGYFFETSLLIALRLQNAVVKDVAIPAIYGDEVSSLSHIKTLITFPIYLAMGFFRRILFQYFLLNFNATSIKILLSIPFLIFGVIWGTYHRVQSINTDIPVATGIGLIAIIPLMIGLLLLLMALIEDIRSVPKR